MWVEEVSLENIKCFDKLTLKFGNSTGSHKWVTLLGENGGGKSTILQALGLLLAGPEGALQLTGSRKLDGWLKDDGHAGKISARVHKGSNDEGKFGEEQKRTVFGYTFHVTGNKPIIIRNKQYNEPGVVENADKILTWLRRNAFLPKTQGWFAVGYGAFRRLSQKSGTRTVPSVISPDRYSNFLTQFDEGEALSRFEQWMVLLDYQIAKNSFAGKLAQKQRDLGMEAINKLLPKDACFDSVDENGIIWFSVNGNRVPTQNLSDGFRSILALAGDLIWRMLEAFPNSDAPLKEEGVVLIDELDVHLHPTWQREIPGLLREIFPNVQFIVATHSPIIAAGGGSDSKIYRIQSEGGIITANEMEQLAFKSVNQILRDPAFALTSTYSQEAEEKMHEYLGLKDKPNKTDKEKKDLKQLSLFTQEMMKAEESPFEISAEEHKMRADMMRYIKKSLGAIA